MKCSLKPIEQCLSRVDSHQHFWQLSRGDYNWLTPELTVLFQDFLPEQLVKILSDNHVSQTVLVQAADSEEETHFLLKLANNTDFVAGVVGWIDMKSPSALARLTSLAKNPYFKGIRPMLQDIEDVNWILNDNFTAIFEFMADNKLSFDALITSAHLPNIHALALRHPKLSIVIDHSAKPALSAAPTEFWQQQLTQIAQCKNVFIKFSGLLTEAPQGSVSIECIRPYFEHIMRAFGADRIMWGSDWPVIKLNGDYEIWLSLTSELLKYFSSEDKNKIWASNARNFYRLPAC
jgi:L-fuconolactonase